MRYLLVEDDEMIGKSCMMVARAVGLEAHFHLYQHNAENIKNLLRANQEVMPNIVQLDGLEGACFSLIEQLKSSNPKAIYFVCSGSDKVLEEAKDRGIKFFEKCTGNFISYLAGLKREIETRLPALAKSA